MIGSVNISLALIAVLSVGASPADRKYEGDWYVSDITDNNTGERSVYAFQTYLKADDPNYVTITMRCTNKRPTFFVEWTDISLPDTTVITLGPVAGPDAEPAEQQYIFEKSPDIVEAGYRASPEASSKIVAAIGPAKYLTVTVHLTTSTRSIGMDVDGTQRAWSRVSRHCPVQQVAVPPL